jgi:hypothetical protein
MIPTSGVNPGPAAVTATARWPGRPSVQRRVTGPALLAASLAAGAAELAEQGYYLFPVRRGDKRPAIDRWEQRSSASPDRVRRAWTGRFAGYNVGLACGPSRLLVIDLDAHGSLPEEWRLPGVVDGGDVLAQLHEWAGQPWPQTRWTRTPSGGSHLWFRAPDAPELRNTAGLLGPMVDTRAAGGYIVTPPSVVGGRAYLWVDDREPEPLPGWLLRLLQPRQAAAPQAAARASGDVPARLRGLIAHVAAGRPGDRNGRLFWAACRVGELIAAGRVDQAAAELLVRAALAAGLRGGEPEARRTVASGLRAGGAR